MRQYFPAIINLIAIIILIEKENVEDTDGMLPKEMTVNALHFKVSINCLNAYNVNKLWICLSIVFDASTF
jgi:hypothetical protein